jgi:hypothetical protein
MDITFLCDGCGQHLTIDEAGAGITIDCPKCGKPVYVPSKQPTETWTTPIRIEVKSAKPYYSADTFPPFRGYPVTSPSVSRESDSPSIYDRPRLKSDEIPPVIHAGMICLLIYVVISFIGLVLFHSHLKSQMEAFRQMSLNPTSLLSLQAAMQSPISAQMQILPAVSRLGMIFGAVSLICAIVAMATDHVSKGLALLIGTSLAIALYYFGINHIANSVLQEQMAQLSQQFDQMQQQMQQMLGGRPTR